MSKQEAMSVIQNWIWWKIVPHTVGTEERKLRRLYVYAGESRHTIPYSFNNVADMRNVQQIHIEIEMKWENENVKYD